MIESISNLLGLLVFFSSLIFIFAGPTVLHKILKKLTTSRFLTSLLWCSILIFMSFWPIFWLDEGPLWILSIPFLSLLPAIILEARYVFEYSSPVWEKPICITGLVLIPVMIFVWLTKDLIEMGGLFPMAAFLVGWPLGTVVHSIWWSKYRPRIMSGIS